MKRKTCCLVSAAVLVALLVICGIGAWLWMAGGPEPPQIEVTTYPEPVDNTYPLLVSAAGALKPTQNEISAAYAQPWDKPNPVADALLTRFDGELDAVHEALAGDCLRPWVVDAMRTTPDPLLEIHHVSRLLCLAGRARERDDDGAAALVHYQDVVRLSQVLEKNGAVIHALLAVALLQMSARDLQRLMASGSLSEAQLQELLAFLDTVRDARVPFAETVAREWLLSDTMVEQQLAMAGRGGGGASRGVGSFMFRRWRRDAQFYYAEAITDGKKPYWERTYVPPEPSGMGTISVSVVKHAAPKIAQGDATLQGLRTQAAIELFRAREGRLPGTLSELAPDILPDFPIDPCDGKPMRYRPADGSYTLYSVGPDKTDDGGKLAVGRKRGTGALSAVSLGDVIIQSPPVTEDDDEQSSEGVQASP